MKPAITSTRLIKLDIDSMPYEAIRLEPDPVLAGTAYRLTKEDDAAKCYIVSRDCRGVRCGCLSYWKRRRSCKHIQALQRLGLLN